jgi:hypothetical protein
MIGREPFFLALTAKGLENIPRHEARNDFTFYVGDFRYTCPWYVADFLSPKICQLHQIDPWLDEFDIESADPNHLFTEFLSLAQGRSFALTECDREFFSRVCRELRNGELLFSIIDHFEGDLAVSNVLNRLEIRTEFGMPVDRELKFLSSHFHDFLSSSSFLGEISDLHLEQILSDTSLKLSTEDDLYKFIVSRSSGDSMNLRFLEFVHFECLTAKTMSHFIRLSCEHFDRLNVAIWNRLCDRLALDVYPQRFTQRLIETLILASPESPLEGIISYLTRRFGGNVHDRGIVVVTGNDPMTNGAVRAAKNAADLYADSYFYSMNLPNQSLCYDFGSRVISPTGYAIRSRYDRVDGDPCHLKSWVIEISMDGAHWDVIDRRDNNSTLNGFNAIRMFTLSESKECRFIRLRQTGPNHCSEPDYRLVISGFEVFGSLYGC